MRRFSGAASTFLTWGPTEAAFNMTGAVTFSLWIRPLTVAASLTVWSRWRASADRQWLIQCTNAVPEFHILDSSGNGFSASSTQKPRVGEWSHIVGVFEPTVRVSCWCDGIEGRTGIVSGSLDSSSGVHVQMGKMHDDSNPPFVGDIRDAAVWHAALSTTEVLALRAGTNPLQIRPASLQGYWTLRDEKLFDVKRNVATVATESGNVPIRDEDGLAPIPFFAAVSEAPFYIGGYQPLGWTRP